MPEVVHLHHRQVPDLERSVCRFAELSVLQVECAMHSLLKKLLLVELLQHYLRTVGSSLQRNLYLILIALIRLKADQFLEYSLLLRHELYSDSLSSVPLEVEGGRRDGEEANIQFIRIVVIEERKFCVSSFILQHYFLPDDISHPAMSAGYQLRPVYLAPLPLGHNRYPHHSFPRNHHQLVLVIAQRGRPEPDREDHGHPGGDVPAVLLWVLDGCDDELLLAEGGDLDPLDVLGVVDEAHL